MGKLGTFMKMTVITAGITFVGLSVVAKLKRGHSVYKNMPTEKNPLEGKKVVFIEDENDKANADGIRGHLKAIGNVDYIPSFYEKCIKRAIDIILSFLGLIVLSPILGIIALAIKIEDPGPVLFTQKRVGQNKQYFKLHKFRSMKMCTPHDVPTHMLENPEQYITKVGKFIRAHSLDELPQIWDIFIGNMSVIGPRPGLWNQDFLTAERDKYGANNVKPGLTGWAQINGRDELDIPKKAKLDGEYVQNMGIKMDAMIFLRSIHVFGGDGSVIEGGTCEMKKRQKEKVVIFTNHSYMLWRFRKELLLELKTKYEVVLVMPFVGHEDDFQQLGFRCINYEIDRRGINPGKDFRLLLTYKKILKSEKPDHVITYSIKPNIYCGLLCRIMGIDYCANVQGLGTAFENSKLAIIVTCLYRSALSKARIVFFENTANAKEFIARKIVSESKIVVLSGAGINLEEYAVQPYPTNNIFHFLYLGRIMKEKGNTELFDACCELKLEGYSFVLDLVGFFEDEYKDRVIQLEEEGLVKFHGFQENPIPFYANADCVVLPSYHEGMSNVLLEASATGRPSITTNIPGCKESVKDGYNGYLCERQNKDSLKNCMRRIMELSIEDRAQMGINGRKFVEEFFDKKKVVDDTVYAIEHMTCHI